MSIGQKDRMVQTGAPSDRSMSAKRLRVEGLDPSTLGCHTHWVC